LRQFSRRVTMMGVLLLLLHCIVIIIVTCHEVPTRRQYKDIQNQLSRMNLNTKLSPPGPFTLEHCRDYVCKWNWMTVSCTNKSRFGWWLLGDPWGVDANIIMVGNANYSLCVTSTDMSYETMLHFITCWGSEFLDVDNKGLLVDNE
jgi:hypothetical protein